MCSCLNHFNVDDYNTIKIHKRNRVSSSKHITWVAWSAFSKEAHGHRFLLPLAHIPQTLVSAPHTAAASPPYCSGPVLLSYPLPHSFCFPLLQAPQCFLISPSALQLLCKPSPLPEGGCATSSLPPAAAPSLWASAEPKVLTQTWSYPLPQEPLHVPWSCQAHKGCHKENPHWGTRPNAKAEQHYTLYLSPLKSLLEDTAAEDAD